MTDAKTSNIAAIRKYFGNVTMAELKQLTPEDREELGGLARIELEKNN